MFPDHDDALFMFFPLVVFFNTFRVFNVIDSLAAHERNTLLAFFFLPNVLMGSDEVMP